MPPDLSAGRPAPQLELTAGQQSSLIAYRDLLAAAAGRFNLTAVRDPVAIERRHIKEALALGQALLERHALQKGSRVLDLGSGAGLPGLPLKVALPGLDMSLLEARGKSCEFLRLAAAELRLDGVTVLQGRAEDFGRTEAYREAFDLVLSRAVAPLPVLIEYALPFLRPGGYLATTKGSASRREVEESAAALTELGGELAEAAAFEPPGGIAQTLVLVHKVSPTPDRFPRRPGMAAKRPIK